MNNGNSPHSIFDKVITFIAYTNQNIFLTGKAGTGKTTLLRRIKENSTKKIVIVAPTGVAAMNAKGTTINSFFQLPPGSFFPGDINLENLQSGILSIESTVANLSFSREKTKLFNELELLVIDEISMVRCDLMDVIDGILRSVRKNNAPFGGVQLLLIGDLFQLPPVTKREDWTFLSKAYASPYFFESFVIRRNPLLQVELTTVFRQTEPEFINILNDIRNNQISEGSLALLNKRYDPLFSAANELNPIIITSHNAEANAINKEKLEELQGEEYVFEGEVSGEFRDLGLQAEQSLKLKEGAQVMFIKNDTGENRKFYNGKIGKVKSIAAGNIYISFPQEDDLLLEKSAWQSFEYKTDPTDVIVQQQVGEFSQYPIKLAWAVTIHKSQGLTFDTAIIDAGKSFVAGQVYVALSRVRTLEGLILKSKITTESLRSNPAVIHYMDPANDLKLDQLLVSAQERYILKLILDHFAFHHIHLGIGELSAHPELSSAHLPEFMALMSQLQKAVDNLLTLSDKFQAQVMQMQQQLGFTDQLSIQKRIDAASGYFSKEIMTTLINPLNKLIRVKPKNKSQQLMQHLLRKLRPVMENSISRMQFATSSWQKPFDATAYSSWIDQHKQHPHRKDNSASGENQVSSLQLF